MPRFIVDVNLPRRFHLWATASFEFAHDAEPAWSDDEIWTYALVNDLIIVTATTAACLRARGYPGRFNSPQALRGR